MVEPSAERTFVTTLGAERQITRRVARHLRPAGRRPGLRHRLLAGPREHARPAAGLAADPPPRRGRRARPGGGVRRAPRGRARGDARGHRRLVEQRRGGRGPAPRGRRGAPDDLAALTTAIAPLLRGDAVAIVRDGPQGCAVHVGGRDHVRPGLPAEAARHQRRRRHPHRRAAGRGRRRYAVGRGLSARQRRGCDQGDPARTGVGADRRRGRRVPRVALTQRTPRAVQRRARVLRQPLPRVVERRRPRVARRHPGRVERDTVRPLLGCPARPRTPARCGCRAGSSRPTAPASCRSRTARRPGSSRRRRCGWPRRSRPARRRSSGSRPAPAGG